MAYEEIKEILISWDSEEQNLFDENNFSSKLDRNSALRDYVIDSFNDQLPEFGLVRDIFIRAIWELDWFKLGDIIQSYIEDTRLDSYFDRFDICEAYLQFEIDYNVSGILQERKSNQRRKMSTDFQLSRMQYKRSPLHTSYNDLEDNGKAIYNLLKSRYNL